MAVATNLYMSGPAGSYASYDDYTAAYMGANRGAAHGMLGRNTWQAERNRYYAPPPPSASPGIGGPTPIGGGAVYPPGTTGGAPQTGGGGNGGATNLSQLADPWINERQSYMTKLSDLLNNPESMKDNPAFKYMQDQGIQAVNRGAAASGMLGSGNRLAALNEQGQGLASQNFFKMSDLLGRLSGGFSQNPGRAADAELEASRIGLARDQFNRLINADEQTRRDARNAARDQAMEDFWRSIGARRVG